VAIGEESGQLEQTLLKTAEIYQREVREEMKRSLSLLEPLLIVILALAIGTLVMAILQPIFQMDFNVL